MKDSENVGILLEVLRDLALASNANVFGDKDTVEEKLSDAGAELIKYLVDELGMDTAEIMLYGLMKDGLDEDEENE